MNTETRLRLLAELQAAIDENRPGYANPREEAAYQNGLRRAMEIIQAVTT